MKTIQVFSSPWCSGCKTVKKVLTENNITFTEIDITTSEGGALAKQLNIKNIPVTFVYNGFSLDIGKFVGSKPETIKQILEAISD